MPTPTPSDVHVNGLLGNVSIAYMQAASGFVADQVFPNVPVAKQSDLYARYDRADWWRNQFRRRAPSTESAGGGWKVDNTANYFCDVWSLHKDIDDDVRANADSVFNMDRDATEWLAQQAMIAREVTWAADYFATSKWTTDYNGAAAATTDEFLRWDDGSSTPINDVRQAADAIHLLCGLRPNKLVMGRQVWTELQDNDTITDRIKYSSTNTTPAIVTRQAVAAVMELDQILVMDGIQVTSEENPAFETSMTTAFIGGKNALLVYANSRPSLMTPSGGYTFSWTGRVGSSQMGTRVMRMRADLIKSDRIEAEMAYDQKLVCADAGAFLNGIVN